MKFSVLTFILIFSSIIVINLNYFQYLPFLVLCLILLFTFLFHLRIEPENSPPSYQVRLEDNSSLNWWHLEKPFLIPETDSEFESDYSANYSDCEK